MPPLIPDDNEDPHPQATAPPIVSSDDEAEQPSVYLIPAYRSPMTDFAGLEDTPILMLTPIKQNEVLHAPAHAES
eukprot:59359-Chlamydomonas_euryale.AAC.1